MVEGLESRQLLTAGVAHASAQVQGLSLAIPAIHGTITGNVTLISPTSSSTEVVDFTAQGKANIIGDGRGSGQHTIQSKLAKKHPTNDTYSNGVVTLTGTTDTVVLHYSGTGHTSANGSFTATLHGKATSISGQHAGLSGNFTARLSGNSRTGPFVVSFSVKL